MCLFAQRLARRGTEPMDKLRERFQHKVDCKWITPLATGEGYWGCDCGLDKLLLELEDYEQAEAALRQQTPAVGEESVQEYVEHFFAPAVKFIQNHGYADWDGSANGQSITLTGCANMMAELLASQPDTPPTPREALDDPKCPYCGYPRSQHSPIEAICPVQPQTALEGGRAAGQTSGDALREALEEIVAVASGERQVAVDDTEGMEWIDKRARRALKEA